MMMMMMLLLISVTWLCCGCVDSSDSASQANTVEMINAPIFVDDMKSYTTYDQRSVDDADDFKPPYNVRTPIHHLYATCIPVLGGGLA